MVLPPFYEVIYHEGHEDHEEYLKKQDLARIIHENFQFS
jgi:hypothetical protein